MTGKFEIVANYDFVSALLLMIPFVKKTHLGKLTESYVETKSGQRYEWKELVGVVSGVTPHGATLNTTLKFGEGNIVIINYAGIRNGPQIQAYMTMILPND